MEYVEAGDCATLIKNIGPLPCDLARYVLDGGMGGGVVASGNGLMFFFCEGEGWKFFMN